MAVSDPRDPQLSSSGKYVPSVSFPKLFIGAFTELAPGWRDCFFCSFVFLNVDVPAWRVPRRPGWRSFPKWREWQCDRELALSSKYRKSHQTPGHSFIEHLVVFVGLCERLTEFFCIMMNILCVHTHKKCICTHNTITHTHRYIFQEKLKIIKQTKPTFKLESRNTRWLYHSNFSFPS